jgi:hypothetical protein
VLHRLEDQGRVARASHRCLFGRPVEVLSLIGLLGVHTLLRVAIACVNLNITRYAACYAASADPIQAKVDE